MEYSYIFSLESRVKQLEDVLQSHRIPCPPADDLAVLRHLQK